MNCPKCGAATSAGIINNTVRCQVDGGIYYTDGTPIYDACWTCNSHAGGVLQILPEGLFCSFQCHNVYSQRPKAPVANFCSECGAAEFQTHTLGCSTQYAEDGSFDFGANVPELAFIPSCSKCGVELCDALDKTWSDDQREDHCYKCQRNPSRKWGDR